jgi:hypothetical protein
MMTTTLTLTVEQLRVLNTALIQLPYHAAAPLIADINAQIAKQQPQQPQTDGLPTSRHP